VNDLDIDVARNTPWVDMSACVKFRLDRPSRLAIRNIDHDKQINKQTNKQTDKHIAFYYIDSATAASTAQGLPARTELLLLPPGE